MEKRAVKKLNIFTDSGKPTLKRLKSLSEYFSLVDKQTCELFFVQNYEMFFPLIVEEFHGKKVGRKKRVKLPSSSDMNLLLSLLEKFIINAKSVVGRRWESANFFKLLEYLCSINNRSYVREQGFTILLYYIDVLGEEVDENILNLLANVIDLSPLSEEFHPNKILLNTKICDIKVEGVNSKECLRDHKEERILLFKTMLNYITEKFENKEFWLNILRNKFYIILFPIVAQELNILSSEFEFGFRLGCPKILTIMIIENLHKWIIGGNLDNFLFREEVNLRFVLEIFRQGFLLPINYQETSTILLDLIELWITNKQKRPEPIRVQLQRLMRDWIESISDGFSEQIGSIQQVSERFNRYLRTLEMFAREKNDYLSKETWNTLVISSIKICDLIFDKSNIRPGDEIIKEIGGNIVGTLIIIWICSKTSKRTHWLLLRRTFRKYIEHLPFIVQWKRALIKLTVQLHQYIFHLSSRILDSKTENDLSRQRSDNIVLLADGLRRNKCSFLLGNEYQLIPTITEEEKNIEYYVSFDEVFWLSETAMLFWREFFNLPGRVNRIKDPDIHALATSAYVEIFDLMRKIEERAKTRPPYFRLFLPIFLNIILASKELNKGRCIAFSGICQLFCYPQPTISEEYLSLFYFSLIYGLNLYDNEVSKAIIRYSSHVFSYCYPGLNGTIHGIIKGLEFFLSPENTKPISNNILLHSITLISSMAAIQDQFDNSETYDYSKLLNLTDVDLDLFVRIHETLAAEIEQRENCCVQMMDAREQKNKIEFLKHLRKQELDRIEQYFRNIRHSGDEEHIKTFATPLITNRKSIITILTKFLERKGISLEIKNITLWSICSILSIELEHNPIKETIEIGLGTLALYSTKEDTSDTASKALSTIAQYAPKIASIEPILVSSVIAGLCKSVTEIVLKFQPENPGDKPPEYLPGIIQAIGDWLMEYPSVILGAPIISQVTRMIVSCLNIVGIKTESESSISKRETRRIMKEELVISLKNLILSTKRSQVEYLGREETDSPKKFEVVHPSLALLEASETLIFNLLTVFGQFPLCEGRNEQICSFFKKENEDLPSKIMRIRPGSKIEEKEMNFREFSEAFSFQQGTILTIHELPSRQVRIIIRDITGKYVWDVEKINERLVDLRDSNPIQRGMSFCTLLDKEKEVLKGLTQYNRNKEEIPSFKQDTDFSKTCMISEMLKYIGEVIDSNSGRDFNSPSIPEITRLPELSKIKRAYDHQLKHLINHGDEHLNNSVKRTLPSIPISHFHFAKLFLAEMGLIDNRTTFEPLIYNERMSRALRELDRRPSRELVKIGVVYVSEGQKNQIEILSNSTGSPLFEQFLNGLGWEVSLQHHLGYSGGLDTQENVDGLTTPYKADYRTETIFHCNTRMPTSLTNEKQIQKKKHIGNDIVHIIWSDHYEDYDTMTITSKFNFVHIIIYPLPNGMFRIQIFSKPGVKLFGPLIDGMIIDKISLPFLVYQTSVWANRIVRNEQKGYKPPFPTRWDLLNEIIERYIEKPDFTKYYSRVFLGWENIENIESSSIV